MNAKWQKIGAMLGIAAVVVSLGFADTQRSVATIQGLFADNTAGDISPQDLRDLLVSAAPDYGTLYVSSSGATTVSSSGTYYESAGTFTLGEASANWTKGANDRIAYGGTPTREVLVTIHGTITCASSTQALRIGIGKNGTVISGAEVSLAYGTSGTDAVPFSVSTVASCATSDYFGILVRNDTAANNVTVTYGAITVLSVMK